jgi:uncharacterized protein
VVFKRRVRRPIRTILAEAVYPRGGWSRAFEYVKHRIRRLPDTPEKIGRGIWAGVFASFTPFYGIHFLVALIVAKPLRGNLLASVIGTWFGNPLTLVPISAASLHAGYFLLGYHRPGRLVHELPSLFGGATWDLWHNFKAMFTPERAEWGQLIEFYNVVFFPYLIGGLIPGIVVATLVYYLTVPLVRAYQEGRRTALREKLEKLRNKPALPPDAGPNAG